MNSNNEKEKRKIKVAWYENNMQFVEPILYYLNKEKVFDIKIFGSPETAVKDIAGFEPDVIIFDYRMEQFNGVQMFKMLKSENLDFVPVFFSIWANDEVTRTEILDAIDEGVAIFDKRIEPASFPKVLYEHYLSKTGKK